MLRREASQNLSNLDLSLEEEIDDGESVKLSVINLARFNFLLSSQASPPLFTLGR